MRTIQCKAALLVHIAGHGICVVSGLSGSDTIIRKIDLPEGSREVRYFGGRGIFAVGQGFYSKETEPRSFYGMQYLVSRDFFSENSEMPDQRFFEFYSHQYFMGYQNQWLLDNYTAAYSCGNDFCATLGFYGQDLRIHGGGNDGKVIYEYDDLQLTNFELEIFLDRYVIVRGDRRNLQAGKNIFLDVFDTKTAQRIFHHVPHSKYDLFDMASYENSFYLVFRKRPKSPPFFRRELQEVYSVVYQIVFDPKSGDLDLRRCLAFSGSVAEIY